MHIGLVIYGAIDTLSGGYLYDRMLVRALQQAGHVVSIYSTPWRSYPRHLADNWRAAWRRQLLSAPVDLWLQDELNHPSLFWLNRTLRRHHRAPIAGIIHHLRSSEEHPRPLRPLYCRIERAYLATLDGYLANSHTTRTSVQVLLDAARPSAVAWPAADHLPAPAELSAEGIAARALLSAPLRILFVGNLIPRKGLHHLLNALAEVDGDWELSVVGSSDIDRDYTQQIRRQITYTGLAPRVRLLGRVDDATLGELYRRHHLFAAPGYEGFGIVYLEAHRFGLPVIALTTGAAHEVVYDGQTGVLAPPGDVAALATALRRFVHDRELLLAMGLAARLRYSLHPTWEQSMTSAVAWLEEFAAAR
ncbi:MAG TPA: glycosyltransferase family 1 protein [Chloroflexi bacterium]|nr:glycosyltransferase family 1 protein [Chloroflexota bacterium]HHW87104.1 glycosyltransferase family 4 protein [Chloroflexota bacterium]